MASHDVQEILPGVLHWITDHEGIGAPVSSYYVERAGVLVDPRVPDGGLEALEGRERPQQIVLTTGLHHRHTDAFVDAFGCVVRAPREAAARLGDEASFEPFSGGDEVATGVTAIEIGGLAPDEYALHLDVDGGAVVLADALMFYGDTLTFVPDHLMGDDPEAVKDALRAALRGLLERDFDHLLCAHGGPLIGGGRAALRELLA